MTHTAAETAFIKTATISKEGDCTMPGRLKKIVDYVAEHTVLKNLAMSRMRLLVHDDPSKLTESTPDDPKKEKLYLEAAKTILGKDTLDIKF
jgi:hypothetical protein